MVDSVRRREFVQDLSARGGYVDVRRMSPELQRSLRDAGISSSELRELAGQDMVIRGQADFDRLFARLDQTDGNGNSSSFTSRGSDGNLTRAGRVYASLRTQVQANRGATDAAGGRRFQGNGTLDEVMAGNRVLSPGARGDSVTRVQQALSDMGYLNPSYTPGTYDAWTAQAVRRFQRDVGLGVDGQVGGETLGALASTAPPPGQVLERSPEYDRLHGDGRLDVTIALGFDDPHERGDGTTAPGMHHRTEREVLRGLAARGFRAVSTDDIRRMSATDRQRLGLDASRLDPNARYFIKDDGAGGDTDTVVRLITPSAGGSQARASFERAMQQDEVVIYAGHARYGTGPDFDAKPSGAGNFVIDGHGNRHHGRPPAGLRQSIGNDPSRSDLRGLSGRPDYQLICMNACSTEEYLHNMRDPSVFGRTQDDTDIIATTMPTRLATNDEHALRFLDGVMNRESNNDMLRAQNRIEMDALRGFRMDDLVDDASMTYMESGFLGNQSTRPRDP